MAENVFSIFVVLHGLVHLFYLGQSRRLFELQPEMVWPDGSWAFSRVFGDAPTRTLGAIGCGIAALIFVVGGAGLLLDEEWGRACVIGGAMFSSVLYLLLWDGTMKKIDNQGAIALLINITLLLVVLIFQWPEI